VDPTLALRLRRIEDQVKLLSDRAGIPWDDGSSGMHPDVVALAREGKTIQAIKLHREMTGLGLAEAKEAVDRLPY
jgi:ribosomal protein L7/L12